MSKRRVGREMFSSRVKSLLEDYSRKELADYYGVSTSTISRWKRGETQPQNPKTRRSVIRRGKTHLAIRKGEGIEERITLWIDKKIQELEERKELATEIEKPTLQKDIDALKEIKNGDLAELIESAKNNRTDLDWEEWRGDYETIRGNITSI